MNYTDISINDGYVIILYGSTLKLCHKDMTVSIIASVINPVGLTPPHNWVICYGSHGEAYNVTYVGQTIPIFLDVGWRFGFWDNHFVAFQALRVIDIYPDCMNFYEFDEILEYCFPISEGFIVVWHDGSYSLYLNDTGMLFRRSWPEFPVIGDYCVDTDSICLVTENGTVYIITPSSSYKFNTDLLGNVSPVRVYCRNDAFYIAIANMSGSGASLYVYKDFECLLYRYLNVSPTDFGASFVMEDVDEDGTFEFAYSLYALNSTHVLYSIGVYDGDAIYEENSSETSGGDCIAFSFYNSFVFLLPSGDFLRVFSDGTSESHSFGDGVWASAGILLSTSRIRLINERGSLDIDVDCMRYCVGSYGVWSKSMVLSCNYTLYNITGSIDKADPIVTILSPAEGEFLNSSRVNVSWYVYDDLMLVSVFLRLDDGVWIDVFGLSSYVLIMDEGNHTIYLNATDVVGRSVCVSSWFVVSLPIELNVFCADNGSWINRSWVVVGWETHGSIYNVSVLVNGSLEYFTEEYLNGSANLTLNDGFWEIMVVSMGRYDFVVEKIYVGIDTTPPVISVVEPQNNSVIYTNDSLAEVELIINVTDNIGVESILLMYNNLTLNISEHTTIMLTEGYYIMTIIAIDKAGNRDTITLSIRVTKSNIPPATTVPTTISLAETRETTQTLVRLSDILIIILLATGIAIIAINIKRKKS